MILKPAVDRIQQELPSATRRYGTETPVTCSDLVTAAHDNLFNGQAEIPKGKQKLFQR